MGESERAIISKLHDTAYYIALKGRTFTDFIDLIELEKLHKVLTKMKVPVGIFLII